MVIAFQYRRDAASAIPLELGFGTAVLIRVTTKLELPQFVVNFDLADRLSRRIIIRYKFTDRGYLLTTIIHTLP